MIVTDPSTTLPLIESPPDAPVRRMTVEELDALVQQAQLEEDIERVGLSLFGLKAGNAEPSP